jgi:hypothetical protein
MDEFDIVTDAAVSRVMPDLASLHERWPQFFRKGKAGSWREEMPIGLHELFWRHHAQAMNACGYANVPIAAVA